MDGPNAVVSPHGLSRQQSVPPSELLLHILNAVSGGGGPIDSAKRSRLCADMEDPDFKAATLSGAWVIRRTHPSGHNYVFLRDRVAVTGRPGVAGTFNPGLWRKKHLTLWDGRFFCEAKTQDIRVSNRPRGICKPYVNSLNLNRFLTCLPRCVRRSPCSSAGLSR